MTPTIVIARSPSTRRDRCPEPERHRSVELFLPYAPVQYGNIMGWYPGEGHNEAHVTYYNETIPPYASMHEAEQMIEQYRALLQSLGEPFDLQVRQKLPFDWRRVAWGR